MSVLANFEICSTHYPFLILHFIVYISHLSLFYYNIISTLWGRRCKRSSAESLTCMEQGLAAEPCSWALTDYTAFGASLVLTKTTTCGGWFIWDHRNSLGNRSELMLTLSGVALLDEDMSAILGEMERASKPDCCDWTYLLFCRRCRDLLTATLSGLLSV